MDRIPTHLISVPRCRHNTFRQPRYQLKLNKKNIEVNFTIHGWDRYKTRVGKLGLGHTEVIKDMRTNCLGVLRDDVTGRFMIQGQIAKYVIDKNLNLITVLTKEMKNDIGHKRRHATYEELFDLYKLDKSKADF